MIFTRYGSRVEIVQVLYPEVPGTYPSWVVIKYIDLPGQREVHVLDLKATDNREITDRLDNWFKLYGQSKKGEYISHD